MATLGAIGLNLAIGSGVFSLSMVAFSAAVYWEFNAELAPRTWARPKSVVKNVLRAPFYGMSWIPWALGLSYDEMMEGIPGTGTRRGGWSGAKLRCNFDHIIAIKFHALCFKVAGFACILCLLIVLPINLNAPCNPEISGEAICTNITSLTDFESTTLAHIPPMEYVCDVGDNATLADALGRFGCFLSVSPGVTARLFAVVAVAWAIYIFACYLIWQEWIDNLALRRVFFFEQDHFQERKEELDYMSNLPDPEIEFQDERPPYIPHPEMRETIPSVSLYSVLYKLPNHFYSTSSGVTDSMLQRQLSSTVEFFDKCVPNQPGYSSSVAAVTILPDTAQVAKAWRKWYACATHLRRLRLIRRRIRELEGEVTDEQRDSSGEDTPVLDHTMVPFTSSEKNKVSVDDVPQDTMPDIEKGTISSDLMSTPSSEQRKSPGAIPHFEQDVEMSDETPEKGSQGPSHFWSLDVLPTVDEDDNSSTASNGDKGINSERGAGNIEGLSPCEIKKSVSIVFESDSENTDVLDVVEIAADIRSENSSATLPRFSNTSHPFSKQRMPYARFSKFERSQMLGLDDEDQLDMFLCDDGMEQLSVYTREFAQSASACCPYGCNPLRVRRADLETLKELEVETEDKIRAANQALIDVRASVNIVPQGIDVSARSGSIERRRARELEIMNHEVEDSSNSSYNFVEADRWLNREVGSENASYIGGNQSYLSSQWEMAGEIANDTRHHNASTYASSTPLASGKWHFAFGESRPEEKPSNKPSPIEEILKRRNLIRSVVSKQTYAVVTFTSRQAAIAARQCLADGSGLGRWEEVEDLPIPPLADAPAWDILLCRAACRPVTLTISDSQKRCRNNCTTLLLTLFCLLYTVPLSYTSNLVSSEQLAQWFPNYEDVGVLSGLLTGLLYTGFFSVCPFIFKALANFGSGATSQSGAEFRAIRYYWIFILVTAFTGTSLASMVSSGLYSGLKIGESTQEVLREVAQTIPTQVSATWLNWIIVRFFFTLPVMYLFQSNTFLFHIMGMKCLSRTTRGGGPGGPMPFRLYVDSGVVFLCVVALAPACPLIAPAATMYYFIMAPVLRWLIIFVFRPQFDAGGQRWPVLHEIFISSMIVAQILLTTMMVLKKAYGPSLMASISILPTFIFGQVTKDRFLRCYLDAGLVQTSELDGWDTSKPTSFDDRQEFRRWLVDCHKASYVPICLAGVNNISTVEPAVAVPLDADTNFDVACEHRVSLLDSSTPNLGLRNRLNTNDTHDNVRASTASPKMRQRINTYDSAAASVFSFGSEQRGATYRRLSVGRM